MSKIHGYYSRRLAPNKSLEVQLSQWDDMPRFEISCERRREDHAGFELCVTVFGYELSVNYYDHRHAEDC